MGLMIILGFPHFLICFATLDFLFDFFTLALLFGIILWIRGFFDGVKPPKGQDYGRSIFSIPL